MYANTLHNVGSFFKFRKKGQKNGPTHVEKIKRFKNGKVF
jgi:hypothetical protein